MCCAVFIINEKPGRIAASVMIGPSEKVPPTSISEAPSKVSVGASARAARAHSRGCARSRYAASPRRSVFAPVVALPRCGATCGNKKSLPRRGTHAAMTRGVPSA